jgi:hypothetical protein
MDLSGQHKMDGAGLYIQVFKINKMPAAPFQKNKDRPISMAVSYIGFFEIFFGQWNASEMKTICCNKAVKGCRNDKW